MLRQHSNFLCPCGSQVLYGDCCGRYHAGDAYLQAPNAVALMRSRYSAFVLRLAGYLQETWHPSTRPANLILEDETLHWLSLELRHHAVQDDAHETVEFVARSKRGGRANRLHEISRFVREGERWFYVDGDFVK